MKYLKNNKGITLITLVVYIILALIVLGILGTLTTNFRSNINNMNTATVQDTEFDKLNLQLLKETKEQDNKIDTTLSNEIKIVFTNGNTYEYNSGNKAIYLVNDTNNIEIAHNIEVCNFNISEAEGKQILKATIQIMEQQRIIEYVL